jgi:uncharacterized protein YkwD
MKETLILLTLTIPLIGCGGNGNGGGGGGGSGGSSSGGGAGSGSGGGGVSSSDPAVQHNLDALNAYRKEAGSPPLELSDQLNQFATVGSEQLADGGKPHAHFGNSDVWKNGFCSGAGENQAPGWPVDGGDKNATIDGILKAMMDEGPGGGHHDNILNPHFALVGIGLVMRDDGLYFTNDFSNACN